MLNLVNELMLYAEDCFAVRGSNPYSTTLSQAADRIRELAEWKNMSACEACATIPSVMEYVQQLEHERDELKAALTQFLDQEGNPPEDTGEWREVMRVLTKEKPNETRT